MPKSSAKPGAELGTPTQGASTILLTSYMPSAAAAAVPTTGPHNRSIAAPRSVSAATTKRVTRAVSGAAMGFSWEASSSSWKTTDASVIESMVTMMPPTVGVTTRRSMNNHLETINWAMAATSTRVVSVAGPPSTTAVMQKGMETAAVNMGSIAPAPNGPMRRTCSRVESPTTTSEAKTHPIQVRLAEVRCVGHDHRRHQQGGHSHQAELSAVTQRQEDGGNSRAPRIAGFLPVLPWCSPSEHGIWFNTTNAPEIDAEQARAQLSTRKQA